MRQLLLRRIALPAVLLLSLVLVAPAAAAPVERGALPATVKHKFGETTIAKEPKRVVVAGLREQDALLAVGVVPVGTTEWFGNRKGAIFPWAKKALGRAPLPTKLGTTDGIQLEKIAALRPDLIVAVYSGLDKKTYEALSKIAPTVAQPRGQVDYGSSWQDEITMSGQATGRPKAAARIVAQTKARLAAVRKAHPGFKGQTGLVTTPFKGTYVYGPQDIRSRFMADIGFTFPKALRNIGGKSFGGNLSPERMRLLDVGALIWITIDGSDKKIQARKLYTGLNVHKQGRAIYLPEKTTLGEATSFISVLSIPLLIDELVPRIARAADGKASTKP